MVSLLYIIKLTHLFELEMFFLLCHAFIESSVEKVRNFCFWSGTIDSSLQIIQDHLLSYQTTWSSAMDTRIFFYSMET
jgi:hypothetical protein